MHQVLSYNNYTQTAVEDLQSQQDEIQWYELSKCVPLIVLRRQKKGIHSPFQRWNRWVTRTACFWCLWHETVTSARWCSSYSFIKSWLDWCSLLRLKPFFPLCWCTVITKPFLHVSLVGLQNSVGSIRHFLHQICTTGSRGPWVPDVVYMPKCSHRFFVRSAATVNMNATCFIYRLQVLRGSKFQKVQFTFLEKYCTVQIWVSSVKTVGKL